MYQELNLCCTRVVRAGRGTIGGGAEGEEADCGGAAKASKGVKRGQRRDPAVGEIHKRGEKEEFNMLAERTPYIEKAYEKLQVLSRDREKRLEKRKRNSLQ